MAENKIHFYQGTTDLLNKVKPEAQGVPSEEIKEKIAEMSNIKNINFLLGAGASADAILGMTEMEKELKENLKENPNLYELYKEFSKGNGENNLENLLGTMYAKQHYLDKTATENLEDKTNIYDLIEHIQSFIYKKINISFVIDDKKIKEKLKLYKSFYQKTALRNKDLARVNIFTTNNDLFNEKALDDLNINYNNGFGGGLERVFNPARFRYTFSRKIDANLEKFEPLENMVYLYKLHGSISWIRKEGNSLFDIQEISVKGGDEKPPEAPVLIYPTPLKQGQSLGSPYADLMREFQTKLSQPNSVLFVIGYSFSDEHVNNIIYQSLVSNASLSIVIFGEHDGCPLTKIDDNRIYRIFSKDEDEKIHYFEYIVKNLLPNLDENEDKKLLDAFVKAIKKEQKI